MYWILVRAQDIVASAGGMKNSIWGSGVIMEMATWAAGIGPVFAGKGEYDLKWTQLLGEVQSRKVRLWLESG